MPADEGEAPPQAACKSGENGGATGPGVTATKITVFVNATMDGPYASGPAGEARTTIHRAVKRVNDAGGICGRYLSLSMRNGFFPPPPDALAAITVPLKPELDTYIADGSADRAGVPMVGTDGLSIAQFQSPWVWPVATPVPAMVRIAVSTAYHENGARTFALVHDGTTPYWEQAQEAFRQFVATLPGASIRLVQPVDNADPGNAEVAQFNAACGEGQCDAVVWAMLPSQAQGWVSRAPAPARLVTAGLYHGLELRDACGRPSATACDSLVVWDPFKPPVAPFLDDPDVAAYADASGSELSPLVEGAYAGVEALIAAIRRAGPVLTRDSLRRALEGGGPSTSLVSDLGWGPLRDGRRVGNCCAMALRYSRAIDGFEPAHDWVGDPYR